MKKTKQKPLNKKKIIIHVAVGALVVAQLFFNLYIVQWFADVRAIDEYVHTRSFVDVVFRQYQTTYKEPATNVKENTLSLANLGVMLPLNEATKNVRYMGDRDTQTGDLDFSLSTLTGKVSSLNSIEDIKCVNMVSVTTYKEPQTDGATEPAGKIEVNGTTHYIFKNPGDGCGNYYDRDEVEALVEAVAQLKTR